jgi:predicted acylesterase/phospholipase RssA
LGPDCPNDPLRTYDPTQGYRFDALEAGENNSDALFVCVSFSGGGTRAAAFAYGVLEGLRNTPIPSRPGAAMFPLLDELDIISSVSGGSFTAMTYALRHEGIFDGRFERKFLKRNVQRDLILSVLHPKYLLRLPLIALDRIDVAAYYYDQQIFRRKTYGDLLEAKRRPFVVINATDMTRRHRFAFTQDDFDLLGSRLDTLPVGWAVAASSAFPLLLSPLRLEYFPGEPMLAAIETVLDAPEHQRTRRHERWAESLLVDVEAAGARPRVIDAENHRYMYLLDGGLADNLGATHFIESYRRGPLRRRLEAGEIDKLVVIIVDSGTDPPLDLEKSPSAPGLFRVGERTGTTAIFNYSETLTEIIKYALLEASDTLRGAGDTPCPDVQAPSAPRAAAVDTYVIDLNFRQVTDKKKRGDFLSMIASFFLLPEDADALIESGCEVLMQHPDFIRLVEDLNGRPPDPSVCDRRRGG